MAPKKLRSPLPGTSIELETTRSYEMMGSWEGKEEREPLVKFEEVRSEKKVRLSGEESGVTPGIGAGEIEMTSVAVMNRVSEADDVKVTDDDVTVGRRGGDAGAEAPGDRFGSERGGKTVVPQGVGGSGRGVFDGDGKGILEEMLPYYLHVSGWLDASAHAAVMAFMTLPCRC